MSRARGAVLAIFVIAACKENSSTATSASAAPPIASSAPAPTVSVAIVTTAAAPTVSAAPPPPSASASDESGPPAWLHLASGERFKERNKEPTCVTIVSKGLEELRCEPMDAPAATVDDVTLPHGRDCPAGFAVSGSRYCSRACTKNADCHAKHKCEGGQCIAD